MATRSRARFLIAQGRSDARARHPQLGRSSASARQLDYVRAGLGVTFTFMPEAPLPDAERPSSKTSRRMIWRRSSTRRTTGFPKGAMTSHANFTTNIENCFRVLNIERAELEGMSTLVSVRCFT